MIGDYHLCLTHDLDELQALSSEGLHMPALALARDSLRPVVGFCSQDDDLAGIICLTWGSGTPFGQKQFQHT